MAALSCCLFAAEKPNHWTVAASSHFEVYSATGDETARRALAWFERLRTFFRQNDLLAAGFDDHDRQALRVVGFRSQKEYEEYRASSVADAYYTADGDQSYIVMASLAPGDFGIASHEYAHYVLHTAGSKIPACLNEGLAEFFSTLRLVQGRYELGGDLPARTQVLRASKWLPLAELFGDANTPRATDTRKRAEIFYAESWALVNMLVTSPQYGSHFRELVAKFNSDSDAVRVFREVYGKSLDSVSEDLEGWAAHTQIARVVLNGPADLITVTTRELSARETEALMAHVSLISGHLEQARSRYQELLREEPGNPDFSSALGAIAFRLGNQHEAIVQWRQAVQNNAMDAELCYRYAILAEEAGADERDVRAALERAVALAPNFDDARYKLALLESHAAEYQLAVDQLRAMVVPVGGRRYAYWVLLASAFLELDKRDAAKTAAGEAFEAAQSDSDRLTARHMAILADTDMTVQFATDSEGRTQMVTTRIPHGTTNFNPFVEPSDVVGHAHGKLSEVFCKAGQLSGFLVRTPNGLVTLEVPDPLHVLMRNSPKEFYCGPITETPVEADYAVMQTAGKKRNVLRGMTF